MSSAEEVLFKARGLLSEGRWVQGSYALDEAGGFVPPTCEKATAWCASGALMRAIADTDDGVEDSEEAFLALQTAVGETPIPDWNDAPGRSLETVLLAFDRAMEIAR